MFYKCPYCDSTNSEPMETKHVVGNFEESVLTDSFKCKECGKVWTVLWVTGHGFLLKGAL